MTENKLIQYFLSKGNDEIFAINEPDAESLILDLDNFSHAFVLACVMDRQIDADRAWLIPWKIKTLIGSFDIVTLQKNRSNIMTFFRDQKLHAYPDKLGDLFVKAVDHILLRYNGNASRIWLNTSGVTVIRRFMEFEGIGPKIAAMAANILHRIFKIKFTDDMRNIDLAPDTHVMRVLIRTGLLDPFLDPNNLEISSKQKHIAVLRAREFNPEYPGAIDFPLWKHGRDICQKRSLPKCNECKISSYCSYAKQNGT